MAENHFGPSAVNVITKTCSRDIRIVSQVLETKVHRTRTDFFCPYLEIIRCIGVESIFALRGQRMEYVLKMIMSPF